MEVNPPRLKVEKMEVIGLNVRDIDAAIALFSELLDTEFLRFEFDGSVEVQRLAADGSDGQELSATSTVMAMDRKGYLELIQTNPPTNIEGFRNIHFKVQDIDQAVTQMRHNGFKIIANMRIGGLREAILDSTQAFGMRMCLVQYSGPSMIESMAATGDIK